VLLLLFEQLNIETAPITKAARKRIFTFLTFLILKVNFYNADGYMVFNVEYANIIKMV